MVLVAAGVSLNLVVRGFLQVPIEGSIALFMAGAALCLFATTAMGIFMATVARSMPQFGLLMVLTLLPLQLLSGGTTPRESMPQLVQRRHAGGPHHPFRRAGPRPFSTVALGWRWCGRPFWRCLPSAACCLRWRWRAFAKPSAQMA